MIQGDSAGLLSEYDFWLIMNPFKVVMLVDFLGLPSNLPQPQLNTTVVGSEKVCLKQKGQEL